ncbi:MAG: hypothetical protein EOO32_00180 [Comamonadaceae bacterium]|nr:MAG: hypothetical protein EOO32_00180 [Comamonadaceae bacterium]
MSIPKTIPVTQLKRLGTRLPTFTMPVTIPVVGSEPVQINLVCSAHRKTEWAKIRDEHQRASMALVLEPNLVPAEPAPAPAKSTRNRKAAGKQEAQAEPSTLAQVNDALSKFLSNGYETNVRKGLEGDVGLVMKFVVGWDLEDQFSDANFQALEDEYGGSAVAAINAYDQAIFQGRLGN